MQNLFTSAGKTYSLDDLAVFLSAWSGEDLGTVDSGEYIRERLHFELSPCSPQVLASAVERTVGRESFEALLSCCPVISG